jgi:hypothetical protein
MTEFRPVAWMNPRRSGRPGLWLAALAAAVLWAGAIPARSQTPPELYYQRVAIGDAGQRCRLFDAGVSDALAWGQIQARNAALRAGAAPDQLDQIAARAQARADAAACNSADMVKIAARVRASYKLYSGLQKMSFPGEVGVWRADRLMPERVASWRVSQVAYAGQDSVVFGVAGRDGVQALTASASFADGRAPYAARLVLRDPARAPSPYLPGGKSPLSARIPGPGATRAILAEARSKADLPLLPLGARTGEAFRFPAAAQAAIAQLDPREAVGLEFVFAGPSGDIVRTAFLEVGDFTAARRFADSAQR